MKKEPGGASARGGMRLRTGSPLPRQRDITPAQKLAPAPVGDDAGDPEALNGWVKAWAWTLAGVFVYMTARWIVDVCIPADPLASAELFRQVPLLVYQMSSTAFFTALVLNLTSLLFEDNAPKRQLALLSFAIKGAACHTDMLLVTGRAHVVFDAFGAIVIPHRYVQWLVTTPSIVYILSKISDFTPAQTAAAIGMDVAMILSGLIASFLPGPFLNWLMFCVSTFCFVGVLYLMGRMVLSAVKEHTRASSRRSLLFIYMCTLLIWSMFPLAWVLHVLNPAMPYGEYLNIFANFMAKVLFSSSIMYGNYMTIAQRRLLAQQAAENAHRVQMVQDLRDAVMRKDQFMSLMSHELRTPLNGIIQLSDALVRGAGGEMNPKGQHFVKTIKNSSNHLLNIINDILDVAALKEGKLTIKHELCSLAKAVDHVVDIVAPLARKEVTIERSVDPRTPLIIADFSRVVQILYNLAGNALKFTHRGSVRVRVAPSADGSQVTLQVADTGIGISEDRINGIWGAFEQVDMSVTRKYGGTGLGLSIVKQLVEAHEGHIEVASVEGRGTSFTVTLPVLQPATRPSLEVQVAESLSRCGHAGGREAALRRRSNRLASSSGRPPSFDETISQLARGHVTRHASGLKSPQRCGGDAATDGNTSGANSVDREDVLYRRRTQELEREILMGELQRRTEHKRSLEESQLASRQLQLSGPERRAERDSRSLERLEMQIAAAAETSRGASGAGAGAGASGAGGDASGGGASAHQRSDNGQVATRGGVASSFNAWRCDAEAVAARAITGRRSLTAADAREAVAAARASGGDAVIGSFLPGSYDHLLIAQASTDSHCSNAMLVRKLSAASIGGGGGGKSGSTVRDTLRMSVQGRGAAAAGGGGGGSGIIIIQPHSGPIPSTTSHLMSDLYRTGRESYDGASSAGADSESDAPRSGRRQQQQQQQQQKAPIVRSGKLLLPVSASLSGNNAAAAAATAPPPGLTLDKLAYSNMYGTVQILSVDDEEVNQIVLEEILTSSGYRYARCMDGLEALEWLCGSETMPDLILLDCMMPNMSGHEFCATLRKVIPGNVLPVIMVSAKSDEDNIVEGLRSGSNDFVRKPYQREELLARIETQLRLKSDSWWLAELVNNVDGRETESMKLLKNILPESIIARMQQGQKFVADSHRHVVILFSDIVGFTSLSSKLPTAEVFLMLSNMFTAFDKLTDRFSVYKVETIGDAYMVAAGHDEDDDKARKGPPLMRVLGFARAMLDVVRNITAPNGERMRIRIVSAAVLPGHQERRVHGGAVSCDLT
ncbi:Hexokinase-3 [Pleodorina starrii]|nr:Hexokinase-3 [Pleodorina starrii]